MKKIKYVIFVTVLLLICKTNIKALTCYYNTTGIGDEKDAVLKVDFIGDSVIEKVNVTVLDQSYKDLIINYNTDGGTLVDSPFTGNCNDYYVSFYRVDRAGYNDRITYFYFLANTFHEVQERIEEANKEKIVKQLKIILLKNINSTNSKIDRTCNYDDFSINYNDEGKIVSISNNIIPSPITNVNSVTSGCNAVYLCRKKESSLKTIFYNNLYLDLGYEDDECELIGENKQSSELCGRYSMYIDGFEKYVGLKTLWSEYQNCLKSNNTACVSEKLNLYKDQKEILKSWCSSVLGKQNYNDECVKSCLSVSKEISAIEKNDTSASTECGFSSRLINWIKNIMRWMKYILPVIVIVLGIIDFIKAIASDKDDELKKAQGKFVKRLVIAAIAFLVPFIIEFVLDKMGFVSNSCGLW